MSAIYVSKRSKTQGPEILPNERTNRETAVRTGNVAQSPCALIRRRAGRGEGSSWCQPVLRRAWMPALGPGTDGRWGHYEASSLLPVSAELH